jgi:hypothetical protein
MPLRDHWWCILVAKYGAFLFTEIGAFVITDYTYLHGHHPCAQKQPLGLLKRGILWILPLQRQY